MEGIGGDISKFALSIIVPVFNESDNLVEFSKHLALACAAFETEYIFVDDGSTDKSAEVIMSLDLANLQCIRLQANSGHMAALDAGYRAAQGKHIVTLDADLQHPPSLIPKMIEIASLEQVDVVYAVRNSRVEENFLKRSSSRLYYSILRLVSGIPIRESAADFRLLTRRAVDLVNSFPPGHSVFRVLIPSLKFREGEIEYIASDRFAGESKYTFQKMFDLAATSIITTSTRPLQISLGAAVVTGGFAVIGLVYVLLQWLEKNTLPGWASLLSAMFLMFSILFFCIGVFSAYLGRVVKQTSGAPFYSIKEVQRKG